MTLAVHAFEEDAGPAGRLAAALGVPLAPIALHNFPDGETLPTVRPAQGTVLVYRSLDRPNGKLMPLLQACDAWRRSGAHRLVLVAPYLCYLRQDAVFHPGQPVSAEVLGALLGERFDHVVTVDPHLHRTPALGPLFRGAAVTTLSAAPALAGALRDLDAGLVVGPDCESAPWAGAVARELKAPWLTFEKRRTGDREVSLSLSDPERVRGRVTLLVDDICASGATLEAAVLRLQGAQAAAVHIAVSHALFGDDVERRLRGMGVGRIVSTDSCAHPTNAAPLAGWLAEALRQEIDAA